MIWPLYLEIGQQAGESLLAELGADPSIFTLVFIPANTVLEVLGYRLNAWSFLTTVLGILAGIYGVNSAAGAWKREREGTHPDESIQ
jgi:hypothetical protein